MSQVQREVEFWGDGHTFLELQISLAPYASGKVPEATLRRWLETCWIEKKDFYSSEDFNRLVKLCFFLKRCRNLKKFQSKLLQEIESNAS